MSAVSPASSASAAPAAPVEAERARIGWGARVTAAVLAVPLLVFAWTGAFARYIADDFCWAGVLRTEGFFRAQMLWYTGYSPRYAFTFLVNVVELAGPAIVPALPSIALIVWVATLAWVFRQLDVRLGRVSPIPAALVLAEVGVLAAVQTAPDMAQSVYWQTGMLTYVLPLILATFLIGWIARATRRRTTGPALLVSAAVTFVAGGLSETYLVPQNVAVTLTAGVCAASLFGRPGQRVLPRWPIDATRVALAHLVAALAGGVLALLGIVIAPSTGLRVGGPPADLWLASAAAIATGAVQGIRLVRFFAPTVLLCLALPGVVEALQPAHERAEPTRGDWRPVGVVTALVLLTLPFCYFPSFYAQNGNPPARSLIVPGALLIAYLLYLGWCLRGVIGGFLVRTNKLAPAVGAGILLLVPLGIAASALPERAAAAESASIWDIQDQQIRAARDAGQMDVTVPWRPPYMGENFVSTNRQDWFNVCVARYYAVRTIASSSDGP